MLKFKKVWGENFLCFEKFELPLDTPHKTLIIGENNSTPACDSNMSGKTALFDSIIWCLYGETSKGEKGDDVINRSAGKNCYVAVRFTIGSEDFVVARYRKHKHFKNTLRLTDSYDRDVFSAIGHKEPQEYLENLIGMDYTAFTSSILFPQEVRNFFVSSTDAEQKKVLDTILGLYVLEDAQTLVKKKIAANDEDRRLYATERVRLESLVGYAESNLADLEAKRMQSAQASKAELHSIEEAIAGIKPALEQCLANKKTLHNNVLELEAQLMDDELKKLNSSFTEITAKSSTSTYKRDSCLNRINALDKSAASTLLASDLCPTCKQPIQEQRREELKSELIEQRNAIEHEYAEAVNEIAAYAINVQDILKDIDTLQQHNNSITLKISELKDQQTKNDFAIFQCNSNISHLNERAKQIRNANNSFDDIIKANAENLASYKEELNEVLEATLQTEHINTVYQFWLNGFGKAGIRSFLLDTVVPMFNEAAHKYASILTDGGALLRASTTSQTKKGEDREKFNVAVIEEDQSVDFKQYSGGYKRRLALAGSLALQSLLKSRTNNNISLFIADEPAENLDSTGVEKLMQIFDLLEREEVSVFVISHDDKYRSYFSNVVTVKREGGKSSVLV